MGEIDFVDAQRVLAGRFSIEELSAFDVCIRVLARIVAEEEIKRWELESGLITRSEIARTSAGGGEDWPTPRVTISPDLDRVSVFVGEDVTCVHIPYGPQSVHKSEISLNFANHDLALRVAEGLRSAVASPTQGAPETGGDEGWHECGATEALRARDARIAELERDRDEANKLLYEALSYSVAEARRKDLAALRTAAESATRLSHPGHIGFSHESDIDSLNRIHAILTSALSTPTQEGGTGANVAQVPQDKT